MGFERGLWDGVGGERGVRTFAHAACFHLPGHLLAVVSEDDVLCIGKSSMIICYV